MVRVRIESQRGVLSGRQLENFMPAGLEARDGLRFVGPEDPADVVIVLNYLKYDSKIQARQGFIWTWHNEPIVRTPFSKGYDRVFTHESQQTDNRVIIAPPVLNWWVKKSFDELCSISVPKKTKSASIIASTKRLIPGHVARDNFVEEVLSLEPAVDVFGLGRPLSLADKWDGLAPYKYSIAIENTSKTDYWTEKIADCFLAYTVPIYFGATNIDSYFPRESYIHLPLENPRRALETVRTALAENTWANRLPAIEEARELVLRRYSLYGQLRTHVVPFAETINRAPRVTKKVRGRRTSRGGWIRGKGLLVNLRNQWTRVIRRAVP